MSQTLPPIVGADHAAREKTAQFFWTTIILSFFMIQAIIWAFAISITSGDHSHAIVAGYDEKAVNWDDTQSLKRASAALGWEFVLNISDDADVHSRRTITLALHDRNNTPIEDAAITLSAFHRGHAADVQDLQMKTLSPGVYSGVIQIRHAGHWQFDGIATRANDQFLIDDRQMITK